MILNWVLHKKYQRTRYINDPNLSNNSITQEIRVFDSGLALEISSDKTEVGIGPNHQATFTFNIKNFGDDWATGSQLSILIPKGINLLNSSMLGRSEQDSEGNTILTIDTGIIVDTKSVNITVEATGYSQPLDKLYDYLWDVNVYGKVTWDQDTQAPTLESKTIRVDSSKGIAEELVKSFLFGSASNQPNSLKTLTAFQKVTTSSEIVEGFMQIGDEYVNDLGTAVTSPIEKIFNTAGDTFSEQTKALKELNLKKGIEATQAGVKNTEQQVNQFPDNVKQGVEKARDKALIKGVGLLVDSATEEVFGPFISGSYQALKLASLSYSDGVVNYQKETNTDKVNLGVTVGKNEEVPQAILQSALAGNTSQIESWANSTVNNFTAQGSYSKTLPNGQVGLNYGYSNATKTLSYGIETSLSLGNGFRLGGKVEGQFGQGQPLPTAFLSVTYTEPEPKNPPQGDRSVSPQSYTNNLEKNFQSILAFADSTFSEPANLSQSIQSLTNGNDNSSTAILDKSGRFLVFTSEASNLIEGDTNGVTDVFIRDIQTKTLERISLSNDGTEANGKSEGFAISADGRYVVFASNASNLIANDSNNTQDIFLRDRITNTTQRVSLANDSSQTNGASDLAAISANGRYIVFSSIASNLVAGDTNEMVDVFVRDLEAGTTELISAASNNSQSNNDSLSPDAAISEDGRYVVFYSYASNLVANDTNEVADIFVRDRQTGLTVRVSAANDGAEGNDISLSPVISADGRYVAFSSLASNLVAGDTNGTGDIFVYDQQTKTIERVSLASDGTEADSNSSRPSISSDGRYVVFQSRASNFGVDNPDFYSNIYLRDRLTRETKLVSPSLNGETDGDSINPSISADGSYIAFESAATNLVDGDTNGTSDIFVYTLSASETSDAEINGIVWNDINGDSIKGSSEPTLTGWTIYLDSNNNNLLDAGETSTLSDSQGAYKFSNLSPNSYTVAQIIQDSYKQTYPVINVTTTASTEEIFTPSDSLSITSTTQNTNATKLINLDAFQTDPRFTNIKGQGYSTVIIDTGIDLDNPLFGADSDRNGIADKIIYEYDFADQDTDASDKNGHGSNIASIAASVASDANIIALKVFKDNGSGYFSDLEAALQWVNQNAQKYNIASVNLSLGDGQNWNTGNPRYGIGDELAAIASQNIIIAAAAGNSFYQFNSNPGLAYPAADSNTISVGAVWADNFGTNKSFSGGAIDYTTGADQIASFSQRSADQLDVFAPGIFITGANATGGTQSMGGTSQATPFISGLAVLAQQIAQEKLNRKLTLNEFRTLLDTTSVLINDGDDENDNVTNTGKNFPRVNALALAEGILKLNSQVSSTDSSNSNTNSTNDPLYLPSGSVKLTHTVTLTSGQTATDINFGNQLLNNAPTLGNAIADQNAKQGTAFNFQVPSNTFTDIDAGDVLTYSATLENGNALPTWLTFDATTRTFSGTPTNDNIGNLNVKVIATDKAGVTVSDIFVIAVENINNAPVLSNAITDQNAKQGTAFNFQIPSNTFIDIDAGDVLTYSATLENGNALPTWLTFNSTNRTFSGTPTNDNVGNLNIKLIATDKAGENVSDIFTITVENINDAPTLGNTIADQNAKQGDAFNFQIPSNTFTDIDAGDILTYSATLENSSALPNWLTFNPTTRIFSGTPTNDNVGNLNVKAIATDKAGQTVSDIFTITVENVNDVPVLKNPLLDQTVKVNSTFTFKLPQNTFSDPDAVNPYKNLVIFGDSLSDTGNAYKASGNTFPPSPNYQGRLSNGLIWVDYFAPDLQFTDQSVQNYAFFGANTGVSNTFGQLTVPGLLTQIQQFKTLNTNSIGKDGLYVIWAGANDFLNLATDPTQAVTNAVTNISSAIATLAELGAKEIVVGNLTDLGALPGSIANNNVANARAISIGFNAALNQALTNLEPALNVDLSLVDIFGLSTAVQANPANYKFTNITQPLITATNPVNPDQYAFWDDVHPTTRLHQLVTDTFETTLLNDGVIPDLIKYSATLADGSNLPDWLNFNSTTRTFSGTPNTGNVGKLDVKVIATDKAGATVNDIFTLAIENVNNAPTLTNAIADQNAKQGTAFNFQVPTNTFTDIDAGDVLTYSATLENGNALPTWLTFNSANQTFSGTPTNDNVGNLNVKVAATDKAGATVNDIFVIAIENIIDNQPTTVGTPGDDKLVATPGSQFNGQNNIVFTGAGKDEVELSTVSVFPNSGNNIVDLGSGDDTIFVNKGDRAFGSDGNDIFDARDGKGGNRMSGGAGDDTFFLGSNDRALGGDGNDKFYVVLGGGNLLSGGAGADQFWIVNGELPKAANTILDFQIGTDVLGISGQGAGFDFSDLTLNGNSIAIGTTTVTTLSGVSTSSLTAANFAFV